jgi:hypothetical protein
MFSPYYKHLSLLCSPLVLPEDDVRGRAATVDTLRAFGCVDFDGFVARLAAQRLDGRYAVSQRLAEAARAARVRAVEIDADRARHRPALALFLHGLHP